MRTAGSFVMKLLRSIADRIDFHILWLLALILLIAGAGLAVHLSPVYGMLAIGIMPQGRILIRAFRDFRPHGHPWLPYVAVNELLTAVTFTAWLVLVGQLKR